MAIETPGVTVEGTRFRQRGNIIDNCPANFPKIFPAGPYIKPALVFPEIPASSAEVLENNEEVHPRSC